MGSEHHLGRRSFVGLLAAGWATGLAVAHDVVRPFAAGAATPSATTAKPDGVVVIGRMYLKDHPKESDADFLVQRLPGVDAGQPVRPQLPALDPAAVADFRSGRVVGVDGWLLSRTEARGAAAVALGR